VVTFATEGFAYVCHKGVSVRDAESWYRVARITSATDSKGAVQLLANTFDRIHGNCTFEWMAVDKMAEFAKLVRLRANYSKAKVERAWRVLAAWPGHLQFCVRNEKRWRENMTEATIK
jgi:hypothetical protein